MLVIYKGKNAMSNYVFKLWCWGAGCAGLCRSYLIGTVIVWKSDYLMKNY